MSSEVSYTVNIAKTPEVCWEQMRDLTKPHLYVPGLLKTDMHTEQTEGVGASRRVFKKRMALDETVVQWQEGESFTLRLHDGDKAKPLPESFFVYSIKPGANNSTDFTATMRYQFPLGALGALINRLIVLPIVRGEIRDVALAVKYYYETGESPSKQNIKQLRKVC